MNECVNEVPGVCACCNNIATHECLQCHMKFCAEHTEFCRHCGSTQPMTITEDEVLRYTRKLRSLCKQAAVVIREMEQGMRDGKPGFSADFIDELERA